MRFTAFLLLCVLCASFGRIADAVFRFTCGGSITVQRLDPIVTPGQANSHVHMVVGGSNFGPSANFASLQQSECTTCDIAEDLSAYWVPELYFHHQNGSWERVDAGGPYSGGLVVYYEKRASTKGNTQLYPVPTGLKMIAGTPSLKTFSGSIYQRAITFACLDYNNASPERWAMPKRNCPDGFRPQIYFPSCWDGVNLDSADHKSHMSYPDGIDNGNCDAAHPYRILSLFYEKYYSVNRFAAEWLDASGYPYRANPYYFSTGDNTGFSFHGDFLDGWNVTAMAGATNICGNDQNTCPFLTSVSGNAQSTCAKTHQTPLLANEVTYGMLPGDLPGTMAGHIVEPAFDPCQPSPEAGLDDTTPGMIQNPPRCFQSTGATTQRPAIGSAPTISQCNNVTCIFVEVGGTHDLAVNSFVGGEVVFAADIYSVSGSGGVQTINNAIVNIHDSATLTLYQTMGVRSGLTYPFHVSDGSYIVRLGFVENYYTAAGKRVFNIVINGVTALANFDIFAAAGGINTAVMKTIPITVTAGNTMADYSVIIDLISVTGTPQFSWFSITPSAVDPLIFGN